MTAPVEVPDGVAQMGGSNQECWGRRSGNISSQSADLEVNPMFDFVPREDVRADEVKARQVVIGDGLVVLVICWMSGWVGRNAWCQDPFTGFQVNSESVTLIHNP